MSQPAHTETNDALTEYYSDKENCFADIREARKAFGSTTTTEEQYDQMEKALGIMYLHCPEDIQDIVLSTIQEAEIRRLWFEF
jgi:hypothetical protein